MFSLSQDDLLEWFRLQYITGDKGFFTGDECRKMINGQGYNINGDLYRQIRKLYAFGYLDVSLKVGRQARYRIKKKYTGKVYSALSPLKRGYV